MSTNRQSRAEGSLQAALGLLELWGLEEELPALELFNAIAQSMISGHRQWQADWQRQQRSEAEAWMECEEARAAVKHTLRALRLQDSSSGPASRGLC